MLTALLDNDTEFALGANDCGLCNNILVGLCDGFADGFCVGASVGIALVGDPVVGFCVVGDFVVGLLVGRLVTCAFVGGIVIKLNIERVGTLVGGMFVYTVGLDEKTAQLNGKSVGDDNLAQDGFKDGLALGNALGLRDGLGLGFALGLRDGLGLGIRDGLGVGLRDSLGLGLALCLAVGINVNRIVGLILGLCVG